MIDSPRTLRGIQAAAALVFMLIAWTFVSALSPRPRRPNIIPAPAPVLQVQAPAPSITVDVASQNAAIYAEQRRQEELAASRYYTPTPSYDRYARRPFDGVARTQRVSGYRKKNGTWVNSYTRRPRR
jgi:hypothetical protein